MDRLHPLRTFGDLADQRGVRRHLTQRDQRSIGRFRRDYRNDTAFACSRALRFAMGGCFAKSMALAV
jgi:hypothetical protein